MQPNQIGWKLLKLLIIFSSLITLVVTAIQLYSEYDRDISAVQTHFIQIERSYLKSISENVWIADSERLTLLINGIVELPDFSYVLVNDDANIRLASAGTVNDKAAISNIYPLYYTFRGEILKIGSLEVRASLSGIYNRLFERVALILASNAIKTFLVALFLLVIINYLITQHLGAIVKFAKNIDFPFSMEPLNLKRGFLRGKRDELDTLADSLNEMQAKLFQSYSDNQKIETEKLQLERELMHAKNMESMGHLTGGVAHDFNNILGIILGNAELALLQCNSDGEGRLHEKLQRIETAGVRAKDIVAQMQAYSRGDTRFDEPFNLQILISDEVDKLRTTLPPSINMTIEIEDNLPMVMMDSLQLTHLLMNLCINARDAMEESGLISIRLGRATNMEGECVSCHKKLDGDWVELSVMDTGSGIKPDVLEYIFDPFYTTKGLSEVIGMGLSVVHGIMHSHNGHILVETELGEGTTFRLLFPPIVID